jgi:hypothetical protein
MQIFTYKSWSTPQFDLIDLAFILAAISFMNWLTGI